jgi:hypothetical protein
MSQVPINSYNLFDPRLCSFWEAEGFTRGFDFADACHHSYSWNTECALFHCPLLNDIERAAQISKRSDLLATSSPPEAGVLSVGEDTDGHDVTHHVYAWDGHRWSKRRATYDESKRLESLHYYLPSDDLFCLWVLEHFERHAPHVLLDVGRRLPDWPQISNPQDLLAAVPRLNVSLMEYLKQQPGDVDRLDPYVFEEFIAELPAGLGWKVQLVANR